MLYCPRIKSLKLKIHYNRYPVPDDWLESFSLAENLSCPSNMIETKLSCWGIDFDEEISWFLGKTTGRNIIFGADIIQGMKKIKTLILSS